MKSFKEFFKQVITAHSGISSKRVCGVLGFLVIMFTIIFCTITATQAPLILETFIWAVCMLLGIDSITSAFKRSDNGGDKQ